MVSLSLLMTSDYTEDLKYFNQKAPIKITDGKYDGKNTIKYKLNGSEIELSLERLLAITEFRNRFAASDRKCMKRLPECGALLFNFMFTTEREKLR